VYIYATKPVDLADFSERIHQVDLISGDMRQNILDNFYLQLGHCQAVEKSQFAHFIKQIGR